MTTEVSEAMVERAKAAFEAAERNPVMILCPRCKGTGSHHGFGEDGNDPDWCDECGGGAFALSPGEELRPFREALEAALSTAPSGDGVPGMVLAAKDLLASLDPDALDPEQFNAWHALDAALSQRGTE